LEIIKSFENTHEFKSVGIPNTEDNILKVLPLEKLTRVKIMAYVDVNHAHDQSIRRSITEILIMLNDTFIRWIFTKLVTTSCE
jgi:hypothetical protein